MRLAFSFIKPCIDNVATGSNKLYIFFMKFIDPFADEVLVPVVITVRAETAELLSEMAAELEVSLDEVLSSLAEESVIGLKSHSSGVLDDVEVPDKCSKQDLLKFLK